MVYELWWIDCLLSFSRSRSLTAVINGSVLISTQKMWFWYVSVHFYGDATLSPVIWVIPPRDPGVTTPWSGCYHPVIRVIPPCQSASYSSYINPFIKRINVEVMVSIKSCRSDRIPKIYDIVGVNGRLGRVAEGFSNSSHKDIKENACDKLSHMAHKLNQWHWDKQYIIYHWQRYAKWEQIKTYIYTCTLHIKKDIYIRTYV